jgi:hypothetical protein
MPARRPRQGTCRLTREWAARRTPVWALDTGLPDPAQLTRTDAAALEGQERDNLVAIAHARSTAVARAARQLPGPASGAAVQAIQRTLANAEAALADLASGNGVYEQTDIGRAAREVTGAQAELVRLGREAAEGGWRDRHRARRGLLAATAESRSAREQLEALVAPEVARLQGHIGALRARTVELVEEQRRATTRRDELADRAAAAGRRAELLGRHLRDVRTRLQPGRFARPPQRLSRPAAGHRLDVERLEQQVVPPDDFGPTL